ncbi:MAG TPA: hypothetical protein VG101_19655 [Puia sp.]|jgi:hypothetical protein|nr:hypothetical protein [Puia sp.]
MERLKELISQLMEQFDRKAEPSQLLQTTQLLEAELRFLATQPAPGRVMPTKIAVMMPSAAKFAPSNGAPSNGTPTISAPSNVSPTNGAPATGAQPSVPPVPNNVPALAPANGTPSIAATNGTPATNGTAVAAATPASVVEPSSKAARTKEPERGVWPFDPLAEKPTDRFTLSQKSREINDIIGGGSGSSLNEKLKSDIVDLRSALNDTPVRDLKKAIGINDRYVFVNQLFRGDEAMYERSIKTINSFRILPEAEYWMERELKVKLGWDENRDVTRYFYQLVKRRFS